MNLVWSILHKVKVEQYGTDNVFIFRFATKAEWQRVLSRGPWLFDKQIIFLMKPHGIGEVLKMDFTWVAFWIPLVNVVFICLTEECAQEWNELVGPVEAVKVKGMCMRVQFSINTLALLMRGL